MTAVMGVALTACSTSDTEAGAYLTAEERTEQMVGCLADVGYEVEVTWNNAIRWPNLPSQQLSQFHEAEQKCYKLHLAGLSPMSAEQRKQLYSLEIKNKQCLEQQGYLISSPPSLETYLDSFDTENRWMPVRELDQSAFSAEEYEALLTECPPPSWYM